jgi:hypothetical protein
MKKVLPVMLLLNLGACAPFHWEKASADQAMLTHDLTECRALARRGALNYYSQVPPEPYSGAIGLSPYVDLKSAAPNLWQYTSPEVGPYVREDRLLSNCMRHRGYDRVQETQQKA